MNKFNVNTPDEWKSNLFKKTSQIPSKEKTFSFKPIVAVAAAVCILFAGIPAFASTDTLSDLLGRWFTERGIATDMLYIDKNIVFEDNSDEIKITCTGIAGDSRNVAVLLKIESTGSVEFNNDLNNIYIFNNIYIGLSNNSYASVMSDVQLERKDEKTLWANWFINLESEEKNENTKIEIDLSDIVLITDSGETQLICQGDFSALITVEEFDTNTLLKPTENEVIGSKYKLDTNGFVISDSSENTVLIPQNVELSDISAYMVYTVKDTLLPDFSLFAGDIKPEHIPFKNINFKLKNGKNLSYTTEADNGTALNVIVNSILCQDNTVAFSLMYEDIINSDLISEISIDGITVFKK